MDKSTFTIGAKFEDDWTSDNRDEAIKKTTFALKEASKHRLYFKREKRKNKIVTIVKDFFLTQNDFKNLLRTLKKNLGVGGTIKYNNLEFQGDLAEKLRKELEFLGYGFKK